MYIYMGKLSPIRLLLSIFFLLFLQFLSLGFANNNSSLGCIGKERDALLKFKQSLVDPYNILSSWEDNTNCCTWKGVFCNNITGGHVVKLHLSSNGYLSPELSSTRLDSSLLELKYLNYLDLSGNYFNTTIPTFLGSMKQLQHLYLSRACFHGVIPRYLGNLSNLLTLDIGDNDLIAGGDLRWISNLSSLEYLDLNGIDLSRQKDLNKVLSMLPSLAVLLLRGNSLVNSHLPHSCVNSTLLLSHVKYLDMSWNKFYGEIPCFLHNMTSLEFLDLSFNLYNSAGQPFLSLKQLAFVDFTSNSIRQSTEWISELIKNNCKLKSLNLSNNEFHGGISGAFKNLSQCRAYELETLNLQYNRINGTIPESIGKLSALVGLDISNNELSGSIPESIGKLSALMELDIYCNGLSGSVPDSVGNLTALKELNLRSNQLNGELPASLGQLSNLERIDISDNSFNGTLSEAHFSKLSKLKFLYASSNSMGFKVGYNWVPAFQLETLYMSSCKIEVDQFPPWLQTQKALTHLDLSNCSISGTLPEWLGTMINLTGLNLSKNNISGPIMELPSSISWLNLYDNMITHLPSNIGHMLPHLEALFFDRNVINGSLPHSLCQMKHLRYLHLSKNNLSGNLLDCWQNFPDLVYVGLSSNELSGIIPKSIGGAYNLRELKLDNNHLRGSIPSTLMNCSRLEILDVGENKLFGEIPEWLGNNLANLRILRLRNNQFHGVIPRELCQASTLKILDIGINKLTGHIPNCFQNFSGMKDLEGYYSSIFREDGLHEVLKAVEMEYTNLPLQFLANLDLSCNNLGGGIPSELTALVGLVGLNISHNNLYGEIPRNIGGLKSLESLDLSNNHLSGKIPESLANLTSLSHLKLSNNNLRGRIPTGRQLTTLEDGPSIYGGNPLLCGDPLPKKCRSTGGTPKHSTPENDHVPDDKIDEELWFYVFVICGFVFGLWGLFGILFFRRSWRYAYFRVIEAMIMKMMGRWIIR